jgi:hypothetical protein
MALASYKVRIVANACITRYDAGEREITDIIESYRLNPEDADLVKAEVAAKRPDIVV